MTKLGFQELLDPKVAGYIITSYKYPKDPNFNFPEFYNRLNEKGEQLVIKKKRNVYFKRNIHNATDNFFAAV